MQDDFDFMAFVGRFWLFILGGIVLTVTVMYYMQPAWRDMETKGIEHGYASVSSKKELLIKLVLDYRKLETQERIYKDDPELVKSYQAQRKAIIDRMRIESSTLNNDEIPVEAKKLMEKNK